jgi:hypothetical protein
MGVFPGKERCAWAADAHDMCFPSFNTPTAIDCLIPTTHSPAFKRFLACRLSSVPTDRFPACGSISNHLHSSIVANCALPVLTFSLSSVKASWCQGFLDLTSAAWPQFILAPPGVCGDGLTVANLTSGAEDSEVLIVRSTWQSTWHTPPVDVGE